MGEIELGVVTAATKLSDALRILTERKQSALVLQAKGSLDVIKASEILAAFRKSGNVTCRSLRPSKPSLAFNLDDKKKCFGLTRAFGDPSVSGTERSRTQSRYIVVRLNAERARVFTASEQYLPALAVALILCRCRTYPDDHIWEPHELVQKGQCVKGDGPVDCN
jgi:hypothetical protein